MSYLHYDGLISLWWADATIMHNSMMYTGNNWFCIYSVMQTLIDYYEFFFQGQWHCGHPMKRGLWLKCFAIRRQWERLLWTSQGSELSSPSPPPHTHTHFTLVMHGQTAFVHVCFVCVVCVCLCCVCVCVCACERECVCMWMLLCGVYHRHVGM